jgi:hypothetical protein
LDDALFGAAARLGDIGGKHMKYIFGVAVAGLLSVAACTQQTASATYDLSLYPACADVEGLPTTEGCVLTQEPMLHALVVEVAEGKVSVQVVADGEGGQLIQEEAQGPSFIPTLADLNGDGHPDLLIPLGTGNVNTTWAVYAANQDASYTRLGEFSGIGWGPSATGLIAVPARSSAASWEVSFYDVEPGGLTLIATVETALEREGAAPSCRLVGTPVLGAQTMQEAVAQYCGDPAVAGIWTEGPPNGPAAE